jgi:hypothetical protein
MVKMKLRDGKLSLYFFRDHVRVITAKSVFDLNLKTDTVRKFTKQEMLSSREPRCRKAA